MTKQVFHHRCPICLAELHNVNGEWKGHEPDCTGQDIEHKEFSADYKAGYNDGYADGKIDGVKQA